MYWTSLDGISSRISKPCVSLLGLMPCVTPELRGFSELPCSTVFEYFYTCTTAHSRCPLLFMLHLAPSHLSVTWLPPLLFPDYWAAGALLPSAVSPSTSTSSSVSTPLSSRPPLLSCYLSLWNTLNSVPRKVLVFRRWNISMCFCHFNATVMCFLPGTMDVKHFV